MYLYVQQNKGFGNYPSIHYFFGIYPVLVLYSINIGQLPVYAIETSLVFSAIMTASLFAVSYLSILFWASISSWKTLVQDHCFDNYHQRVILWNIFSFFEIHFYRMWPDIAFFFQSGWSFLLGLTVFILKPQTILKNLKKLATLERAAAVTSIILILFFSYGHVSGMMSKGIGFIRVMELHLKLMALWGILLVAGIFMVSKIKNISNLTKAANVTAVCSLRHGVSANNFVDNTAFKY